MRQILVNEKRRPSRDLHQTKGGEWEGTCRCTIREEKAVDLNVRVIAAPIDPLCPPHGASHTMPPCWAALRQLGRVYVRARRTLRLHAMLFFSKQNERAEARDDDTMEAHTCTHYA